MQVKRNTFAVWLLFVLSLASTIKTQTCGVVILQEQPQTLSNATNQPFEYAFNQELNGQQLTLTGVISIENNGNVDYPLFLLSAQPNLGQADFPASLANIASASYSNVDPLNTFVTLTVANDANDLETRNVNVALPFNEDIAWVVTFDYGLNITKFLFRTRNAQIEESFNTNFPEFQLTRNIQLDIGCNATFQSECGVVTSNRIALIQRYYENIGQVSNLNPAQAEYTDYSYDTYRNGSILATSTTGQDAPAPQIQGTPFFRTQDGLIAFNGSAALQQQIIDTSMENGYTWFAVFSYQEPLPENFLLFKTVDEIAHPFEITLVRQANGRRQAVVNFTNDNLRLQSGDWYSQNDINELTFVLEQQIGSQQLHLLDAGSIVSSEVFTEPRITFSGQSQFFVVENETFEGQFRLYDFTEMNNTAGVFFNILRNPADIVPAVCQSNCLYKGSILDGVEDRCLQCNIGYVLDNNTQTCVRGCPNGTRNVAGRCFLCQNESCTELIQGVFEANRLGPQSLEIVEIQPVVGLVQPFSDNFNVVLTEGVLGQDYTWDIQNQSNPNRATYFINYIGGFNPQNPVAVITLLNPENYVDANLNVLRNQNFNVGLIGQAGQEIPDVVVAVPTGTDVVVEEDGQVIADLEDVTQPEFVDNVDTLPDVVVIPVVDTTTREVITEPVAPVLLPAENIPEAFAPIPVVLPEPQIIPEAVAPIPVIIPEPVAPVVVAPIIAAAPIAVAGALPGYILTDPCPFRSKNGRCERVHKSVINDFKGWAIATFVFWVIGMLVGACGLCFKCPALRHNGFHDFYYQKWLQAFLMGYFIAFWALYNSYYPLNLRGFLRRLLDLFAVWHGQLWDLSHPIYNEHYNFYQNNIYNMFVISFGFPQVLILFIMVLALIVFLIHKMQKAKLLPERFNTLSPEEKIAATKSYRRWHCIYRWFFWMAVYTVWMMFCLEAMTFIIYNFMHYDWDVDRSAIKRFSLAWAIIFLVIYLALLAINWMIGLSDRSHLYVNTYEDTYTTNNYYHDPWWFVQTGLKRTIPHRLFQPYQYFFYMFVGFMLAVAYDSRVVQIVLPFFFFLILVVVFGIILRPAVSRFWQIEQIIAHFLLFMAYLFLFILVLDDNPRTIPADRRWRIGYVVAFFAFLTIFWNMCVLIGALIYYFLLCKRARAGLLPMAHGVGAMRLDRDHETNVMLAKNVNGDYQTVHRDIRQDRFVPVGDHLISNLSQEKFRSEQKVRNVLSTIPADVEYKQGVNVLGTPGNVVTHTTNTVVNTPGHVVTTVGHNTGNVVHSMNNTVVNPIVDKEKIVTNTVTDRFIDGTKQTTTNVIKETKHITQDGLTGTQRIIR